MRIAFLASQQQLSGIAALTWVAKDNGELDRYEGKPAVPPNCVLVKVSITRTEDISDKRQKCWGNVIVRYWADVTKSETSNKAPESALARSLAYYDTVDDIYTCLQGFYNVELDTFSRTSQAEEERRDGLVIMRFVFATSWIDLTAEEA